MKIVRTLVTMLTFSVVCVLATPELSAQCTVCDACIDSFDCALGEECAQFDGIGGRCVADCSLFPCPGDSECWNVTDSGGGTVELCLNPTADVELCPASYQCGGGSTGGTCLALGLDCTLSSSICGPLGGDYCINSGSEAFCSCQCATAADCGPGAACVEVQAGTLACVPGASSGACDGVTCPIGEVCDSNSGACVPEGGGGLCDNVTCSNGAVCSPATGTCIGGTMDVPAMEPVDMGSGPPDAAVVDVSVSDPGGNDTRPPDTAMEMGSSTLEAEGDCGCQAVRRSDAPPVALLLLLPLVGCLVVRRKQRPNS